jgi:hypothetical protein
VPVQLTRPVGFGNTPGEEKARSDMIVRLSKDYNFELLKFDAVVGQLRPEKQEAFIRMMTETRKYNPDLILQAFNRNLILAPQIYGNPWFLKDEEYPQLARLQPVQSIPAGDSQRGI